VKLKIGIDGKTYEVEVEVAEEDHPVHAAHPAPVQRPAAALAPPAMQSAAAPQPIAPSANEGKVCRSPMVGLVTKVLVRVGQTVTANEPLVVLEAMKMESNITSPFDGRIARINAKPGDAVQVGQVLAELE
jgi:methylmalonyl-CoA carboxyltransferase small subunit